MVFGMLLTSALSYAIIGGIEKMTGPPINLADEAMRTDEAMIKGSKMAKVWKSFAEENRSIFETRMPDYSIDHIRLTKYLSIHNSNQKLKDILTYITSQIRYVPWQELKTKFISMCHKANAMKNKKERFIIYNERTKTLGQSNSFYSLLGSLHLNFDYFCYDSDELRLLINGIISEGCKPIIFICNDASYDREQLFETTDTVRGCIAKSKSKFEHMIAFIVPVLSTESNVYNRFIKNDKNKINYFFTNSGYNPVFDYLIVPNIVNKDTIYSKLNGTYLYLQSRMPDFHLVNNLLKGQIYIPNDEIINKQDYIEREGNLFYPFIRGCEKLGNENCPPNFTHNVKYTFNGNLLDIHMSMKKIFSMILDS